MGNTITYRHWQPGDDDAVLELLLPAEQCGENYYRKKFNNPSVEPEGIRLAFLNERVVGHVFGSQIFLFVDGKTQNFGMVTLVFVASDMRRQGIATRLMRELHTYFEGKGYRGSILDTNTKGACELYQKVGYQLLTRELRTRLLPRPNSSPLEWTEANQGDFNTLHQLKGKWARQNFPVPWNPDGVSMEIHERNMKQYRVLRCGQSVVGYAKWSEPSEHYPHGLIPDPIAPDMDLMVVIASVQAAIPAPHAWQTADGSRYEEPLRSLGYTLQPTEWVDMLLSFGPEIDWTWLSRTFW